MNKIKGYLMLFITAMTVSGCSAMVESETDGGFHPGKFPDYGSLLHMDAMKDGQEEEEGTYVLPVRVYMDNTGSMQAYIFDENMACHADPKFVRLMRAFRDMERIFYETRYYTIRQNEQTGMIRDWLEYDGSIYQDFEDPGFYFSWKKNDEDGNVNGPLSMLYLDEGRLNPQYINIVMTDLAEQNVNNTHLAQQIHQLCSDNGCTAYMLAFQFEYHGDAQVPDPDRLNDIISGRVDGPRPYYIIFTGPSQYMDLYMERFVKCLEGLQLHKDTDFYFATSKLEWDESVMDQGAVRFEETVTYEQIVEESETGEISGLSKNICRYDNVDELFDSEAGGGLSVFCYCKDPSKSIPKEQRGWRLNFTIPLGETGSNDLIKYSLSQAYYIPAEAQTEETLEETEKEEAKGQDAIEMPGEDKTDFWWKEIKKPVFHVETEDVMEDEHDKNPSAYRVRLSGEPDRELETDSMLIIFTITQTEKIPYREPGWIKKFDTGPGEDYFQRTYNLSGFYDILFGSGYLKTKDGNLTSRHIYAEIPVLVTGLKGEKGR